MKCYFIPIAFILTLRLVNVNELNFCFSSLIKENWQTLLATYIQRMYIFFPVQSMRLYKIILSELNQNVIHPLANQLFLMLPSIRD